MVWRTIHSLIETLYAFRRRTLEAATILATVKEDMAFGLAWMPALQFRPESSSARLD